MPFGDRDLVPFYSHVEDTAKAVQARFKAQAADAARFVEELATSKQRLSPERFEKRLQKLSKEFDGEFSGTRAAAKVRNRLRDAMNVGADTFSDRSILNGIPGKGDLIKSFAGRVEHYADNYYERVVIPRLMKAYDPSKSPKVMKRELKQLTRKLLKGNDAYWKNVTNSSVSYSYHYGYLQAASQNNHTKLMYVAVLDQRTTAFCRAIDGQVIKLAPVLDRLEEVAEQEGEEVEQFKYWKLADTMKNPTPRKMLKMGISIPPFHGHCRTTVHAF